VSKDRDQPGRADGDSGGEEPLSEAFGAVARQLRHTSREILAPWDITPSHLRALRVLGHHGAMHMSRLSSHLNIAARSATEVVDALEAPGLVRRRPDPEDRRATLVQVTECGASVLDAIRAARGSEADRAFDRLSQQDRDQLACILRKLRESPR
jgi:DNA-binding MarR family transcriptional regulator